MQNNGNIPPFYTIFYFLLHVCSTQFLILCEELVHFKYSFLHSFLFPAFPFLSISWSVSHLQNIYLHISYYLLSCNIQFMENKTLTIITSALDSYVCFHEIVPFTLHLCFWSYYIYIYMGSAFITHYYGLELFIWSYDVSIWYTLYDEQPN